MPSSSNPLNLVSAALLIFCGFLTAPLGIIGTFSDTGEIRWVFILMAGAGLLLLRGGVQAILDWRRATREEEAHQAALYAGVGAVPPAGEAPGDPGAKVLAHWTYAPEEWREYTGREYRFRKREAFWLGMGVTALGTVFLMMARPVSLPFALALAALIGAIFGGGKLLIAKNAREANAATGSGEVIISPWAVLLNGRYHVLQDGRFHFGGVRYVPDETPPLLEFTVLWNTRKGTTNDQVRVPVPRGREEEARALAASFPGELERALKAHDVRREEGAAASHRAGSPA
ncbi:MAG TPA: hypothetical protein VHG28_14220 [Longimicrobiaceae bacterium]|nr:hypothetical protein [Longimicrobiaceae bacterium]